MRNDPRIVRHRAEDLARWRAAGLLGTKTIAAELHAIALAHAAADAVVSREGRMSYRALDEASDRIAAGLLELGARPGDPVLFQVNNRLAAIPVWYGTLKAGLIPVATLAAHRRHEIGHIGRAIGAKLHIVEAENPKFDLVEFALENKRETPSMKDVLSLGADSRVLQVDTLGADISLAKARALVEEIQRGLDADDVAVMQLSGGTTGVPKLIPRFHAEYWYNARAYAETSGWSSSSRIAHLIPIIHNAGIVCAVHGAHAVGACLVLGTPDFVSSLPLMKEERATDVLVGHGHFLEAERHLDLPSLRRVILSGAKPPTPLFDRMMSGGAWVGQLFGMAEGFFAVSFASAPEEMRRTTVGTAMSAFDEIKILEPGTETTLPDGQVGELCCRGPYTLVGYFDAAEHNRAAFTSDGYYRTGDLAKLVVHGDEKHLSIEGRIKDLINRGGEKVNAEEVELLLLEHPEIDAAAVVAMPDERLGERACAFLVARGAPLALAEVQAHLAALGVAKYKWPERLEWRPALAKSNVNKIDKKALRAEIQAILQKEAT